MFKKSDPFSYRVHKKLLSGTTVIGTLDGYYQVVHYDVVQGIQATPESKGTRTYHVMASQRINLYNKESVSISPVPDQPYENYPVLLNSKMLLTSKSKINLNLIEYSPQTINSQVQMSGSTGTSDGAVTGSSNSSTVGSSTSDTKSYSSQVGLFSFSDGYQTSHSTSDYKSTTRSSDSSQSKRTDSSSSSAMSIKDWGSYAMVLPESETPVWTFGQEYPWDAVSCRKFIEDPSSAARGNGTMVHLEVPDGMAARLTDGKILLPPSHLATFGINFITKAMWQVEVPNEESDVINIDHEILYFSASHELKKEANGEKVKIFMDRYPTSLHVVQDQPGKGDTLNAQFAMGLMGLDPVGANNRAAIVGFIGTKFAVKPTFGDTAEQYKRFKIYSTTNDLLVEDTTNLDGYTAGSGFKTAAGSLHATLSSPNQKLKMSMQFKVTDSNSNFFLFLKHWKTATNNIKLTFIINGQTDHPIIKHVDAFEAEGGESNILSVALRDNNYASVDYHDYLELGVNLIEVTIEQADGPGTESLGYQIKALSIEKG